MQRAWRPGLLTRLAAALQTGASTQISAQVQAFSSASAGGSDRGADGSATDASEASTRIRELTPDEKWRVELAQQMNTDFDASAVSAPIRLHQLIGDPSTGVADDTTTAPLGDGPMIECVWEDEKTEVEWYRYSEFGRDVLPYMHMDSRLSDHSKNMMYLLRARDPKRWTIEALAAKFRIRRQRVLAILALKELEAQQIQSGELLPGPLRAYAFDVPLRDVFVHEDGQPVELTQMVELVGQSGGGGGTAAGDQAGALGAPPSELGSLSEFLADEGGEEAAPQARAGDAGSFARQLAADVYQWEGDLAHVMPQLAATAQQLQLQLLQLLQRYDFSCDALKAHLLEELSKAEDYYAVNIAGTPVEQLLAAQLSCSTSSGQQQQASSSDAYSDNGNAAPQDAAAAGSQATGVDFAGLRAHIESLTDALRPLVEGAGLTKEREAAQLAGKLRRLISTLTSTSGLRAAAGAASSSGIGAGADATSAAASEQQQRELQEMCSGCDPEALVDAFNRLDFGQRRALLQLAPAARAQLNIRGVDLRAAASVAGYTPPSGGMAGAPTSQAQQPPRWPGQVPALVDLFSFQEIPTADVEGLVTALDAADASIGQLLPSALRGAEGGGLGSEGAAQLELEEAAGIRAADLRDLRQLLTTYQTVNRAYDMVVDEQEVQLAGRQRHSEQGEYMEGQLPPLPREQQHAMMRILLEVDPLALQKLTIYEKYYEQRARAGGTAPTTDREQLEQQQGVRQLRQTIHTALKGMRAEAGDPFDDPSVPMLPLVKAKRKADKRGMVDTDAVVQQRASHDLLAAWLDAEVIKRVHHRGSGERHMVRPPSYPNFEGYTLKEFDRIREGEYTELSRVWAQREDDAMWKEFREKLLFALGLIGTDLQLYGKHARPQKPVEGFGLLVHPYGSARKSGQQKPFVAEPSGQVRPLNHTELELLARKTPKPRRRTFSGIRR